MSDYPRSEEATSAHVNKIMMQVILMKRANLPDWPINTYVGIFSSKVVRIKDGAFQEKLVEKNVSLIDGQKR